MKKINRSHFTVGVLIWAATLTLSRLLPLPEFLSGLGLGLGVSLMLIASFVGNRRLEKLRALKQRLLKTNRG